jgi:hypothetical protein
VQTIITSTCVPLRSHYLLKLSLTNVVPMYPAGFINLNEQIPLRQPDRDDIIFLLSGNVVSWARLVPKTLHSPISIDYCHSDEGGICLPFAEAMLKD